VVDICPTITAETSENYKLQMERIEPFAHRIHVDASDGKFAPIRLLSLDQIWWRGDRTIDLHMMFVWPTIRRDLILALAPRLVIIHAEAEGNFLGFASILQNHGIEVGVALLPKTPVSNIAPALDFIDHVLIFSGNLGHQGGSKADLSLLAKARELKKLRPAIEVGWDGGVDDQNIRQIAEAGVDVINTGGFVQNASDPNAAYAKLVAELGEHKQ
jgi:ribulose-phosphate 3-epimerase